MSNGRSSHNPKVRTGGRIAGTAVAALLLLPAISLSGEQKSKMKTVKPRELVRTEVLKYTIFQVDQEVGSESVTRDDYDDNSIVFQSEIEIHFTHGSDMSIETSLTVEEESYFPMRYRMAKRVSQGTNEFDDITDIEWFANVAVIYKNIRTREDTTRITLPTGAVVLDPIAAHHLNLPLFWYNKDLGGTQSFNVLDPNSKTVHSVTLRPQTEETIEVAGETVNVTRYEFINKNSNFKVYVDANDRIVKVDQGYMVYELSEWSENNSKGE
jgi:hypothetical protein